MEDNTTATVYSSDGATTTLTLNAGSQMAVTIGNNGSEGLGDAIRIKADKPISAIQIADSDGIDATAFLPTLYLGSRFGIPESAQYIAVACPHADTIVTLYDDIPQSKTCSGDNTNPGKIYFGSSSDGANIAAGAYVETDKPVYIMYEVSSTNDEHNLFGQMGRTF